MPVLAMSSSRVSSRASRRRRRAAPKASKVAGRAVKSSLLIFIKPCLGLTYKLVLFLFGFCLAKFVCWIIIIQSGAAREIFRAPKMGRRAGCCGRNRGWDHLLEGVMTWARLGADLVVEPEEHNDNQDQRI